VSDRAGTALSVIVARLEREDLLLDGPARDSDIMGVSDDSRRTAPGDLFCAWRGSEADGHRFLPAAVEAGAVAALVEEVVTGLAIPQVVVRDGRRAAAVAANLAFGDPVASLLMVGVTGTNGKTTTVGLLRHLLMGRAPAASLGTLGALLPDGSSLGSGEPLTTPGPVELAATLSELVGRGVRALAMEVSSHALQQGRVHALRFDAAVFTNISRDHLDYHGTEAEYVAAKYRLADLVQPGGSIVYNVEDPAWDQLAGREGALGFGIERSDAAVRAEGLVFGATGTAFRLTTPDGAADVKLPLLGAYNVQNALAAAGACASLGFGVVELTQRLSTAPQVPGRLERIAEAPCPVLTDYAHTPDALERVLLSLRPLVAGRLIVVFGAGGDRDRGKRPLMGAVAAQFADLAIVTSDNPRTEDPERIIEEIVAGMAAGSHERVTDRRAAIARALEVAGPQDLVLLAGKGHETYQVLGTEKIEFDERRIVAEILGEDVA
jgi:UDP-N-acetylmuramoyl-L-alanyl-D-glutamate--2,6-diaminopimelate ligase